MKIYSYPLSISILFSRKIMSAKSGEMWKKPGRCLNGVIGMRNDCKF